MLQAMKNFGSTNQPASTSRRNPVPGWAQSATSQSTNTRTRWDNWRCGGYSADSAMVGTFTWGNTSTNDPSAN